MYYRVAIRREEDQLDRPPSWQWKSTILSSLQTLFQFLRLYGALPQDHLRVFSSSSRESLEKQLAQENKGLSSHSVTAAQFLHERRLSSREIERGAPDHETRGNQEAEAGTSAVTITSLLSQSSLGAHALYEGGASSLERRRGELERGAGGDHDIPYTFSLPTSLPQVLVWANLLVRVRSGELEP